MACPAVSRWASVRLPLTRRFRKPPYDPGRWDFPSPVLTLAFLRGSAQIRGEAQALTCIHPAHAGLPTNSSPLRAQRDLGSVSERRTGTAKYPEPLCCAAVLPPCRRRPASPRRTLLPLHRSYGLMRQTCCPPSGFGLGLALKVFAGCCQPLLGTGPSRRYLCQSFPACLDLYSGCSQGARARYFPQDIGLPQRSSGSARRKSPTATSVGGNFSELQSFTHVQTHRFARHAGSSHLAPLGSRQPWLLRPRLSGFVTSPCSGYAFRPKPGN